MRCAATLILLLLVLVGRAQEPCNVSLTITPPTCPEDHDASITVVPGQPGLYTYSWAHAPLLNSPYAGGLEVGSYSVTVSDTSGCISVLDTVIEPPFVPALGTMAVTNISCAGRTDGSVTFTVAPGPYTWHWTDDPGLTSNTRTGLGIGDYTAVVLGGQCPSYITGSLGIPDILIQGTAAYCPSAPPLLTTYLEWGFQPDIYSWSTGATGTSLQVVPGMTGPIVITATDTSADCVATGEITLTQLPSPTVTFSVPDSVCIHVGVAAHLTASDADSLIWRWGASGLSNDSVPPVVFHDPLWQPISLQGFDTLGCGSVPVEDSVFVRPRLPAVFTAEQLPCTPLVELWLGSTSDSCAFFIGDSLALHQCHGWVRLDLERYRPYDLTFYSTQPNRCDDTASFHIDVRSEPRLFLPNAFTPNNDGINDTWPGPTDIPEDGYEVRLFNRWGAILWTTNDTKATWNGDGSPNGVYGYTMRMRDPCEPTNEISQSGHVTLFR